MGTHKITVVATGTVDAESPETANKIAAEQAADLADAITAHGGMLLSATAPIFAPPMHYLISVAEGVEATIHGPFGTPVRRDAAALNLHRSLNADTDSLFALAVTPTGIPTIAHYSDAFFEDERANDEERENALVSMINTLADTDGWAIFSAADGWQLQRLDDPSGPRFAGDVEARAHVGAMAAKGSALHAVALAFLANSRAGQ